MKITSKTRAELRAMRCRVRSAMPPREAIEIVVRLELPHRYDSGDLYVWFPDRMPAVHPIHFNARKKDAPRILTLRLRRYLDAVIAESERNDRTRDAAA